MRRVLFAIREGFNTFFQTGIAGGLTILAFIAVSGTLAAFNATNAALFHARNQLGNLYELELFLYSSSEDLIDSIVNPLNKEDIVLEIERISPEIAAERFAAEFGGEIFDLLGENPLPSSIIVHYDPKKTSPDELASIASSYRDDSRIEDVAYEGELLSKIELVIEKTRIRLGIVAIAISVIAFLLTVQTVRVASRFLVPWVRAVTLVGGKPWQIKAPFAIAGGLAGLIGGIIGGGGITLVQSLLAQQQGFIPSPNLLDLLAMLVLTIAVGASSAAFSAPRGFDRLP